MVEERAVLDLALHDRIFDTADDLFCFRGDGTIVPTDENEREIDADELPQDGSSERAAAKYIVLLLSVNMYIDTNMYLKSRLNFSCSLYESVFVAYSG